MLKNVTIADVARQAKTNIASVSYTLNGRQQLVSQEVIRRVHQAVEELGYRPSRHARQLSTRSNMALAMQMDASAIYRHSWMPSFPLASLIQQGISAYAAARGYRLHLLINEPGENVTTMLESQVLSENVVDGVILMGSPRLSLTEMRPILKRLNKAGVAVASIAESLASVGVPIVAINLRPAVVAAVSRLSELNCRRVAYIGMFDQSAHEQMPRYDLFKDALEAAGIELVRAQRLNVDVDAYQRTLDLVDQGRLPDAVIYGADHLAMAGLKALNHRGIRVPRDVRILGVDHAPYTVDAPLSIASLDQRFFDRGQALAKILLDQINYPKRTVPERTELDAFFVDGESLGTTSPHGSPQSHFERSLS